MPCPLMYFFGRDLRHKDIKTDDDDGDDRIFVLYSLFFNLSTQFSSESPPHRDKGYPLQAR